MKTTNDILETLKQYRQSRTWYQKLHSWFRHYFIRKIRNIKWWFLHRTIHKLHIINTGLPPGYYDTDTLLVAVMYKLFETHIVKERDGLVGLQDDITYWELEIAQLEKDIELQKLQNEDLQYSLDELKMSKIVLDERHTLMYLYNWLKVDRPKLQASIELVDDRWYELEQELYKKDTEMLKLLVEIRGHLWT